MDFILDNLFGLIPLLIPIFWVLRLVSNRKKRQSDAVNPDPITATNQDAPEATPPSETVVAVRQAVPDQRIRVLPRPLSRNTPAIEAVEYPRIKPPRGSNVPPVLKRLENLSPLARGMVWSFILDKPPGI